jgi:hypothetical protein
MVYKYKTKKYREEYYKQREIKEFLKRKPKYVEYVGEGERIALRYPKRIHRKGQVVEYKGKLGKVKKVTSRGVYYEEYQKDKTGIISHSKVKFIKNKDWDRHANPQQFAFSSSYPIIAVSDK